MGEKSKQRIFITTEDGNTEEFPIPDGALPVFGIGEEDSTPLADENFHKAGGKLTLTASCRFSSKRGILRRLGIYITNNDLKMHGQPMERKIAGRKGVRKKEHKISI